MLLSSYPCVSFGVLCGEESWEMIGVAGSVFSCEVILDFGEIDYVLASEVRACRQPVFNSLTCQSILC